MNRIFPFFLLFLAFSLQMGAQIQPGPVAPLPVAKTVGSLGVEFASPLEVIQSGIFGGDCFDITNVGYGGDPWQIATFNGGTQSLGIDRGAVFSTGFAFFAVGPNDVSNSGFQLGGSGSDPDINALAPGMPGGGGGGVGGGGGGGGGGGVGGAPVVQFDNLGLTFDITPTVDQLVFQFVFASEEYCERSSAGFDDRFCLLMKGPGVSGTMPGGYANLTVLPVFPPNYVGAANVDNNTNANLWRSNMPASINNCAPFPGITGPTVEDLQFDGKTVLLTAAATVIPCSTYHIKIKLADVGDGLNDSAVFLRAFGNSTADKAFVSAAVDNDPDQDIAVESCDQANVTFTRANGNLLAPLVVPFSISGTATNGTDYGPIPSTITIPAGQTEFILPLNIKNDALTEGIENIKLTLLKPCSCLNGVEEIFINDYVPLEVIADPLERCGPGAVFLEPTVFFGDEPYSYKWSNGSTNSFISPFLNSSANFTVTITDDCAKTKTATFAVKVRLIPNASTNGSAYLCLTGAATVEMKINLTGEGPWTIEYNRNGDPEPAAYATQTPFFLTLSEPGAYLLTEVYDGGQCEGNVSGGFNVFQDEVKLEAATTNIRCFGFNDGAINTTVSLGIPQYFYNWSPNLGNVPDPTNLAPGLYRLTVTDSKACTTKDSFLLTQPPVIALAVNNIVAAKCSNPNGGSATVAASGGVGNLSVAWPNGQNSATATGLAQGNYTATVTDATGCTKMISVNVPGDFATPTAQAQANGIVTCGNQNVPLNGNGSSTGAIFTYLWSGGSFSGPIDQLTATAIAPGNYQLQVTNTTNGCTAIATANVGGNVVLPTAQAAVSGEINCQNTAIGLNGNGSSTGNFSYNWSGPGLTGPANQLNTTANQPGQYQLLITNNATGCLNSATIVVGTNFTQPDAVAATPNPLNCNVLSVVLNGSGSSTGGNFSYNWTTTDGQITANATSLNPTAGSPGTYQILVTNTANGCTRTASTILTATPQPQVAISSVQNVDCFGNGTGSATAVGSLGSGGYSFAWPLGQTGATATNLPAGSYLVTISDSDGCTNWVSATISEPTALGLSVSSTGQSIVIVNDGTATASPAGGTAPYSFLWSNMATTASISGLAPGVFTVVVTDANGCTLQGVTEVAQAPCQLQISATIENAICNGSATGTALLDLQNETAPLTYAWSNQQTGAQAIDLAAGSYSVIVTDANGCTIETTVTIGEPDAISILDAHSDVACANDSTGSIALTVGGGTTPYTYIWTTMETGSSISNLPPGLYSATISDGNGCQATKFVSISAVDNLPPNLVLKVPTVAIDDNGKATLTPALFDNGSTDNCGIIGWTVEPPFFNCSQLGLLDVTISATDVGGNTAQQITQVNIIDNKPPILTCPPNREAWSCAPLVNYQYPIATDNCLGNGGVFDITGGLPSGVDYPIGVTTNSFSYTDAGGNVGVCSFTVTVWPLPTVTADNALPLCHGDCNGSITPVLTDGKGPYSLAWANGQTGPTASALCTGSQTVSITDGGGCVKIIDLFLPEPATLTSATTLEKDDIAMGGIGAISISVNGGTAPYSFNWTKNGQPFSQNQNLTGLFAGSYSVVVTDVNGCVVSIQNVVLDDLVTTAEPSWASGLVLSPNPTSGLAQLNFGEKAVKNLRIDLADAQGRLLKTLVFENSQSTFDLDLREMPAGVYSLKIQLAGEFIARRLVVAR